MIPMVFKDFTNRLAGHQMHRLDLMEEICLQYGSGAEMNIPVSVLLGWPADLPNPQGMKLRGGHDLADCMGTA